MASGSSQKSNSSASSQPRDQAHSSAKGGKKLDRKHAGYYAGARVNTQGKPGRSTADSWRNPSSQPSSSRASKTGTASRQAQPSSQQSNVRPLPKRGVRPVPTTMSGYGSMASRASGSRYGQASGTSGGRYGQASGTSGGRYGQASGTSRAQQRTGQSGHRTVREIREQERMAAARAKLRKRLMAASIVCAAIALVIAGLVAIRNSSLFTITSVTVEGADYLSENEVIALAGISDGETLLRVDTGAVEQRLASSPWISSVHVKRSFPDGIVLDVTERSIAATVEVPINAESSVATQWVIASDGTWLAQVDETALAEVKAEASGVQASATTTATTTGDAQAAAGASGSAASGDASSEEAVASDAVADSAAAGGTSGDAEAADNTSADAAASDASGATEAADSSAGDAAASDASGDAAASDGAAEMAAMSMQSTQQEPVVQLADGGFVVSVQLPVRADMLDDLAVTAASGTASSGDAASATDASSTTTTAAQAQDAAASAQATEESLAKRVAKDSLGVPRITGISTLAIPAAGTVASDGGVTEALAVLSSISDELYGMVVSVTAPSADAITLVLSNDVSVSFGSASDASTKERIVLDLMQEHAGEISYINVRVPDRPAWRGLQ